MRHCFLLRGARLECTQVRGARRRCCNGHALPTVASVHTLSRGCSCLPLHLLLACARFNAVPAACMQHAAAQMVPGLSPEHRAAPALAATHLPGRNGQHRDALQRSPAQLGLGRLMQPPAVHLALPRGHHCMMPPCGHGHHLNPLQRSHLQQQGRCRLVSARPPCCLARLAGGIKCARGPAASQGLQGALIARGGLLPRRARGGHQCAWGPAGPTCKM